MSIIGDGILLGAGGESASIFVTGLSDTDTVSAEKGGKTVAGKWTSRPNPIAHGLPDGYTELEYIKSTGTQYINTGIPACSNTHVICVSEANNSYAECLFGSRVASANKDIRVLFGSESYFISGLWDKTYGYTEKLSSTNYLGKRKFEIRNKGIYVDDALVYQNSSSASGTGTNNIYLFAMNDNGSVASKGSWTIYSAEFYNGNIMTGRFVPCRRNSDSSIGMYDLVSGSFFANAGTGTFAAGIEIPAYINGFEIYPIKSYGTWTISNSDDTKTADVLIDAAAEFEVTL